jgi:hypothetical protein
MAQKILICYKFKNINPVMRKQFDRKLFGTIEKTHSGKYITKIKGYLTNKNYRKPVKSTILVEENDLKKTLEILKIFQAEFEIFYVTK